MIEHYLFLPKELAQTMPPSSSCSSHRIVRVEKGTTGYDLFGIDSDAPLGSVESIDGWRVQSIMIQDENP